MVARVFLKTLVRLVQLAGNHEHDFNLLKSVIEVNNKQQTILLNKVNDRFGDINGKRVAVLGLAFKPETDDVRESPALNIVPKLVSQGSDVIAYDPIAIDSAKRHFGELIHYTTEVTEALKDADFCIIITDWHDVKSLDLNKYRELMKNPVIFDGRNCYSTEKAEDCKY